MPVLYFVFDGCSFVLEPEVRQVESSSSILLSQDCSGYSRFFCISIQIVKLFVLVLWKIPLITFDTIDRNCIESRIALGSILIFTILILLIHEHGTFLYLCHL